MRSKKKIPSKVEQFFKKELAEFNHLFLMKVAEDSYVLFEKFTLNKTGDQWVTKTGTTVKYFEKLSSAAGWAILHNAKQYTEAERLLHWDARAGVKQCELELLQKKINKTDPIIEAKTHEAQHKLATARRELNKYLKIAKYWQTKGFYNEIAPTGAKTRFAVHR